MKVFPYDNGEFMIFFFLPLIGPGSVWASAEYDIFMAILMGISGIFVIILCVKLFQRYQINKSKPVLYLGIAMLLFIVSIVAIFPSVLDIDYLWILINNMITRLLGLSAVFFYFLFGIEIFNPIKENANSIQKIKLIFLVVNAAMIVINYIIEISLYLLYNQTYITPVILLIEEIIITLPFLFIFLMAFKLSRRAEVRKDQIALKYISFSGIFMFLSYLSLAIDDIIALDNPSSLPMWIFTLLGFIFFYLGVARPKKLFENY